MKKTLRRQYFRILSGYSSVIFAVLGLILLVFNIVEYIDHKGEPAEEVLELLILLLVMALLYPVALYASWRLTKRLLAPIQEIAKSAELISSGQLGERLQAGAGNDEIAQLARSLNKAFERYQNAVQRIEQFSADASHQLRTPLAAMRTRAEVCLQRQREPEEYERAMVEIVEQVQRMSRLVEQLLDMSRLGSIEAHGTFVVCDASVVVRRISENFRQILSDAGLEFVLVVPEGAGLPILCNELLLSEAVSNLVWNAFRFTPEGGTIAITVRAKEASQVEIVVEDSGPGIEDQKKESIFQRFFKGTGSEGPGSGSGLGLAIVHNIVTLHQGRVWASDSAYGGAAFHIVIPCA
ncbi:MAG: ATP-binding protein [Verrucomicrobiota bacterium]|nr:ATP-binding protein [Verrucomicrobiota bacterium]